jgi:adenosine deaminase
MMSSPLEPLSAVPVAPVVAALPKADLHIHQEWGARLDRVLARREGRPSYAWRAWAERLMHDTPPGAARLAHLAPFASVSQELDAVPKNFVARVADLLTEAAADGAVYVEVRFGNETVLRPDFMVLFRETERRVQARYPRLHAEALVSLLLWSDPERVERVLEACIAAQREGLAGVDLLYKPYETEAEWEAIYRVAVRAASAGLGLTVHAGEVSTANIAAALKVPGLRRLGHAVYAAQDPRLLELVAVSGVSVECCLSCNVVMGAVPSYEEHPIRRFIQHGIPVALCTDDPVQVCTTIGREYAIAHLLGFSAAELLDITRTAIQASFAPEERRAALLTGLRGGNDPA